MEALSKTICSFPLGLRCPNALFRHEVAYVLGQVQSGVGRDPLLDRLRDAGESDMVRHECAEALGSIAGEGIEDELKRWVGTAVLSFSSPAQFLGMA